MFQMDYKTTSNTKISHTTYKFLMSLTCLNFHNFIQKTINFILPWSRQNKLFKNNLIQRIVIYVQVVISLATFI